MENKKTDDSLSLPFYPVKFLVYVKEYTGRKRKKRRKKQRTSTDGRQTKLNAPHVRDNIKILTQ